MKKKIVSKKMSGAKKVAIAGGAAAGAAALALGAYYLYGPKGKQNRKQLKGWAVNAKKEVVEKASKMKEMNKETYEKLVSAVTNKYKNLKDVDAKDLVAVVKELKGMWTDFSKSKAVTKVVKKVAQKAPAKKKAVSKKK